MRDQKNVIREQSLKIVDEATGELVETKNLQTSRVETEPDFVKLYIADIVRLKDLPKGCNPILHKLLEYMNYRNEIVINAYVKKTISDEIGMKVNSIEHNLQALVESGIITRIAPGTYFVNPDLFGKGRWSEIRELRLMVKYDAGGRTFHIEKDTQLELHGYGFDFVTFDEIEREFGCR